MAQMNLPDARLLRENDDLRAGFLDGRRDMLLSQLEQIIEGLAPHQE